MEKPLPADFKLIDTDVCRVRHAKETFGPKLRWLVSAIALTVALLTIGYVHGIGAALLSFIIGLYVPAILAGMLVEWLFLSFFIPRYKAYKLYEAALERYEAWLLRTEELFWLALDGRRFEQEVTLLLYKLGHKPVLIGGSGDQGRDIVLEDKTIVQCKAHAKPIAPSAVRDLFGTLQHFMAPKAVLISRRGFTKGARTFAEGKPIELWSLEHLLRLHRSLRKDLTERRTKGRCSPRDIVLTHGSSKSRIATIETSGAKAHPFFNAYPGLRPGLLS